ncbi:mitochondrial cardiolipin hydrolase [Harmonia axyridis]|uniref:mitochondrial cardiolipin hydrolase n=1 Tax=Harmonia axyridis TaxID=115357 RepID=UPI001E275117|nr:mitochondrial cardiolipin hydrolase [Harmonia axyridis]
MQTFSKLLYVCFTIAPIIFAYFVKIKKKESIKLYGQEKYYYKNIFLFYTQSCRDHLIKLKPCDNNCPQNHLILLTNFIATAKQSISICVLTLQLFNIFEELIKAHHKGVEVKIIMDREMIGVNSPKLQKLGRIGIPVKTQGENSCIHHKFCIVDEDDKASAKMFFGSMNFTLNGMLSNYEHITLTNDYRITEKFTKEFNALWKEFELI